MPEVTTKPLLEWANTCDPTELCDSDESLLAKFLKSNDRDSFEQLMRRYQHEIYSYLRRYIGDDDLAEDAFQMTFIKVFQRAVQFDPQRRFRPWLYGIATHLAIDLKRHTKRRHFVSLDVPNERQQNRETSAASNLPDHRQEDCQTTMERSELRQQLQSAIQQLGEPSRSVLELVYLQGLPQRDAAQALNVPIGTVKSRLHAAVRKLADVWKRNY